jgi:hypothetical protein
MRWFLPRAFQHRPRILRAGYVVTGKTAALAQACDRFGVELQGGRADGFAGKSAGCIVRKPDGLRLWLKVSGLVGKPFDTFRHAEYRANDFVALPKPHIVATADWIEEDVYWRGVLMTLSRSPRAAMLPWATPDESQLSDAWFEQLRAALAALRQVKGKREALSAQEIAALITVHVGPEAPHTADEWYLGHGDLHWANLASPHLMLFDWEHWGLLPRGFDVGRLLGCSAHSPRLADRIAAVFADEFVSASGRVGLLAGLASLKSHIAAGELDAAAAGPIDSWIGRVLAAEAGCSCAA